MATLYFVPDDKDAWTAARWLGEEETPKGKVHHLEKMSGAKVGTPEGVTGGV